MMQKETRSDSLDIEGLYEMVKDAGYVIDVRGVYPIVIKGKFAEVSGTTDFVETCLNVLEMEGGL